MTIEVACAETVALLRERMVLGNFTDPEEVILDALRAAPSPVPKALVESTPRNSLSAVFAHAREILNGHELDFSRNDAPNPNRDIDFS